MPRFLAQATVFILICGGVFFSGRTQIGSLRAQTPPQIKTGTSASTQQQDEHKVLRLKKLIEAMEKALVEEDEDEATEYLEETETYIADWSIEFLERKDVIELLERIKTIRKELGDGLEDPGVKSQEDVGPLADDFRKSELELIEAAEAGTEFDFPIDLNDKVLAWVGVFSGRIKETIQNSLSRGTRYLPMIRQVFAEEGIPQDLAYLPIVESGFRNEVRSWAKAVGMWQFIPSTGRSYGLQQDAWIDERRDPIKSTRAAARYLKYLYNLTDDWYLALAGYNAGPGTVNRAVQGTESRNFWDHARSKYLWNDTKNYVPQLCAAILVGKHPERFGMEVPQLEPHAYEIIEVNKSISLNTLSARVGLDPELLKDLNPELTRRTTPPRTYQLKVPVGASADIANVLGAIPAAERLEFRSYKILKGDSVLKVAARYNTTPEDLLDINAMTFSQFKAGRVINVPIVVNTTATAPKTSTNPKNSAKPAPKKK
ncbi:MAG: transglycosylase SLT domain-containing protein [Holophagales bacterium]|jgi:membrane-bound lytic murein transglycosylase D|nr:transglycosylase SLT domain-containing protein [Holophagales bacterium]